MERNCDFTNSKNEFATVDRLSNISDALFSWHKIVRQAKAVKQATTEVARLCLSGCNMDLFDSMITYTSKFHIPVLK
jgi:hypothetical protein